MTIAEVTGGLVWLRRVLVDALTFWIHCVTVSISRKTSHHIAR
jgi:hypothetical protein